MTWDARPHGPIQKLASNLWRIEQQMESPPMGRAMDLIRRPNGDVWIHNAVALEESAMKEIEQWGRPAVMLVPNGWHRMDAPRFKERYPDLRVFAPKGAVAKVREKLVVDGSFDDIAPDADLSFERLDGIRDAEAAVRVVSDDGVTLILCDAVFNMKHRPGIKGWMLKAIGSSGGPRVTSIFKFMVLKDKAAFRASLERLANTPKLVRVLLQHDDPMDAAALKGIVAAF
jgi:hypothetical protein